MIKLVSGRLPRLLAVSALVGVGASVCACSSASTGSSGHVGVQRGALSTPGDVFAEANAFTVQLPVPREKLGPAGFDYVTSRVVHAGLGISEATEGGASVLKADVAAPTVTVSLPVRGDGTRSIRDSRTGVALDIGLEGATPGVYRQSDGVVAWPAGYRGAYDTFATVTANGFEEYAVFPQPPEQRRIAYKVALSSAVKGLRLIGDSLEFLDAQGRPGLRLAPPDVVDATGTGRAATVDVSGCAYDTDWHAPFGRPLTSPGARECTVEIRWDDSGLQYPLLVDPNWHGGGYPNAVYGLGCGWTSDSSGSYIVCTGGYDSTGVIRAETYMSNADPTPGNSWFTLTQYSPVARAFFGYITWQGPLYQYLVVAGGTARSGNNYYDDNTVYFFAPSGWYSGGTMSSPRVLPAVAQGYAQNYGNDVLISGGWTYGPTILGTSDYFDMSSYTIKPGPNFADGSVRAYHTATECDDGSVLIAGGENGSSVLPATMTWDPNSPTQYTTKDPMLLPVFAHTATNVERALGILPGGLGPRPVKVTGGNTGSGPTWQVQETDCSHWQSSSLWLSQNREAHLALPAWMSNGHPGLVLVGGDDGNGYIHDTADTFDLNTGYVYTSTLHTPTHWGSGVPYPYYPNGVVAIDGLTQDGPGKPPYPFSDAQWFQP